MLLNQACAISLVLCRFDDINKLNELQRKYEELLEENRHTQIQLVDAIAENGHTIAQLAAVEEEKEKLREAVENVRRILQ